MAHKNLDPHMWNLETLFKSIFEVPVYQRPYSWDKEQVEVLLSDIQDAFESDDRDSGYYTGNIIVYDKDEKINGIIPKYDIIDGQQRITTFSLILLAVYHLALSYDVSESDRTLSNVKSSLWKIINRDYVKELPSVKLNSIEKKCFASLLDSAFDKPKDLLDYCLKYKVSSKFEERVINNFTYIVDSLKNSIAVDMNSTLDYADYLLQYVQFIVIEANCKENKVFSMFESINSKGKRLEEIDLIKTHIFSKLDESNYATYLDKWGQLIIKTKDNLYDYLYNYIKAYLCFYRQNISVENFKKIAVRDMFSAYGVNNEKEAFMKLLDDMYDKVDYYLMLSDTEAAYKLVKNNKFRFYYKIFTEVAYKHPKSLFLRTLTDYSEGKINKDDVVEIVTETVGFMVKFLSISDRDSKDAITMFSAIMSDIYENKKVIKDNVITAIAAEYINKGITADKLKSQLLSIDAFNMNKKLTTALLALYDSTSEVNGNITISYDQAYTLLDSFSDSFSLDHLLVQTPKATDSEYKYYKDDSEGILVLKQGHDFPTSTVVAGMDYDIFTSQVLNKIGNLRIYYRDKNSGRQNTAIALKEYNSFNTYADIEKRGKKLVDVILDKCIPQPQIDLTTIQKTSKKRSEATYPKMDKLIEFKIVNPGDKLYVISGSLKPEDTVAELLDEKYVKYNGEKMTLNAWGCKITGWKSIRIYDHVAIVGETETLHEKRIAYMKNHNET